jgi:hypothetical protein
MSWKTCCCCFLSTLLVHVVLGTNTSCPAWHYYNNATGQCECGHGLSCRNQVEIRNGYCATSSKQGSDYLFGECPFLNSFNIIDRMYSEMPSNTSQLDEVMCGPYNRRGLLCGECKESHLRSFSVRLTSPQSPVMQLFRLLRPSFFSPILPFCL